MHVAPRSRQPSDRAAELPMLLQLARERHDDALSVKQVLDRAGMFLLHLQAHDEYYRHVFAYAGYMLGNSRDSDSAGGADLEGAANPMKTLSNGIFADNRQC